MKQRSSHFGAGLLAGAALGAAAALFVHSAEGKKTIKATEAKVKKMQGMLVKELKKTSKLTKEKYDELVEKVMSTYAESKAIAEADLPPIRAALKKGWKDIEKHIKHVT